MSPRVSQVLWLQNEWLQNKTNRPQIMWCCIPISLLFTFILFSYFCFIFLLHFLLFILSTLSKHEKHLKHCVPKSMRLYWVNPFKLNYIYVPLNKIYWFEFLFVSTPLTSLPPLVHSQLHRNKDGNEILLFQFDFWAFVIRL